MDEKRIVGLCKAGRTEYFQQLAELYEEPLYRYCFRLCENKDNAMDIYQETWLKAIGRVNRYSNDYPFKTWLFAIATNTYKDLYRREKRRSGYHRTFKRTEDADAAMEKAVSTEMPADKAMEHKELQEIVKAGIAALGWKHRTVVILRYFEEMPVNDIGRVLGIPAGTVKSRLAYARLELKKNLEGLV